jgi:hypothetical protein
VNVALFDQLPICPAIAVSVSVKLEKFRKDGIHRLLLHLVESSADAIKRSCI